MSVCPAELVQAADAAPLALFADGLDTAVYRFDPGTRRFRRVSVWQGGADSLTVSSSGEVIAARVSTAVRSKDVHAGPVAGPLARLSDTWPQLRGIRWGTQERLSYQAPDGPALHALVILPAGRSRRDGPFPLVTVVHGGPDDRYADEFMLGWWPIDLLIADGIADPSRLGIGGRSHGGFMAAWAVGQTGRFKAALMLMLHGQDDTNVPVGQAMYFHRALAPFGVEHELVVYPREGHLIAERDHQIDVLRRTRAWSDRWLAAPAP